MAAALIALVTHPGASIAAQEPLRLVGAVRDTAGLPVEGALVYVDTSHITRTDRTGDFALPLPAAGTYLLHLRGQGFAPRSLRFTLDEASGDIDAGLLVLSPGPGPVLRVTGRVQHAVTGEAVVVVAVGLNAETRAITDMEGAFQFGAADARWGVNLIEVRRIGFEPAADTVWLGDPETTLELTIQLRPLPVQLAEVIVEGDRTIIAFGRLAEFYRRRSTGLGHYITGADIERRRPFHISDLLRQVPGFTVTYGTWGRPVVVSRRFVGFGRRCVPVVFVDGMRVVQNPEFGLGIDDLAIPDHVAGIELYSGPAEVPPQFNTSGSQCGAIVIWTR